MRGVNYAVVRVADSDDDADAYGPFSSREGAEKFRGEFNEWVAPGYEYLVVELFPIRAGQREIRNEREMDERDR